MSISMSFFSRKTPQPQQISKPLNPGLGGDPFASSSAAPSVITNATTLSTNTNTTNTNGTQLQTQTQTRPQPGQRSGSFRAENTFAPSTSNVRVPPPPQQQQQKKTITPPPLNQLQPPPTQQQQQQLQLQQRQQQQQQQSRTPPPPQQQQQLRPQDKMNRTPSPNPNYRPPISKPITVPNAGPDPRDVLRPYSTPYPPLGPPGAPPALPPPLPGLGPSSSSGGAGNGIGRPNPTRRPSGNGSGNPNSNGTATGTANANSNSNANPNANGDYMPGQEFIPAAERGIDTKSGGSAGMAGVGRRGFAAAARAAMFVNPNPGNVNALYPNMGGGMGMGGNGNGNPQMQMQRPPMSPPGGGGPQGYPYGPSSGQGQGQGSNPMQMQMPIQNRRPFPPPQAAPRALDMDSLSRSSANGTPPLSAGSGYSSPSPGLPTVRPFQHQNDFAPVPFPSSSKMSPITPKPLVGINTAAIPVGKQSSAPVSPDSEYGGLAYADSDGEDSQSGSWRGMGSRSGSMGGSSVKSGSRSGSRPRGRLPSPPIQRPPVKEVPSSQPIPIRSGSTSSALLRTISTSSSTSGHSIQFGSVSARSRSNDRGGIRIGGAGPSSVASGSMAHSRDNSMSSTYSQSSEEGGGHGGKAVRSRTNSSAAIAQALGLSQRPPSEYARLGGPGINGAPGRVGRSASNASSNVPSRHGRSASNASSIANYNGSMNTGVNGAVGGYEKRERDHRRDGSITSNIDLDLRRVTSEDDADADRRGRGVQLKDTYIDTPVKEVSYADTRVENEGAVGGAKTQRSNTVQGIQSPDQKPIKLPTRSMTSPQLDRDKALSGSAAGAGAKRTARRAKTCKQCVKGIEDGRWVSVDGGGVLCEKCWKNMYLPKCQRCDLPIERQAVSSSDGQLKGKYHKECFNCHICHKPFPDKSFYVYDGQPLCAYHYHEANDTLCAAAMCGQPIEGPCAISASGDHYHPEHMTCEHPGHPRCMERLDEYWEVDGRMLCERHAAWAGRSHGASGSEDEDDDWEKRSDLKAMKRITRFIDLTVGAGLGPLSGVGAGAGTDETDSGLR